MFGKDIGSVIAHRFFLRSHAQLFNLNVRTETAYIKIDDLDCLKLNIACHIAGNG